MSWDELAAQLSRVCEGPVTVDGPMGELTTFRAGGTAAVFVEAETEGDLLQVARLPGDVPVAVLGRGSNMLVSDDGFPGVAVRLGPGFRGHESDGLRIRLGGGMALPQAARLTAKLGLAGFEFAAEIPGSVGGGVRMNAGAHGRSFADVLLAARIVDLHSGSVARLETGELDLGYRRSNLGPKHVVVSAELQLHRGLPEEIAARIADHLDWRRRHQPGGRSAGSVFKNPPGDSAGRIIDAAGLKGERCGGAQVSDVHANFIVTDRGARAGDVADLIRLIRTRVSDRTGIQLELEVCLVGAFPQLTGPEAT